MSLPIAFSNSSAYFTAAVEFLKEYAWIYEHANTRCLQAGVFERMPHDMIEFFVQHATNEQLNNLPLLQQQLQLPSITLNEFRSRLQLLTPIDITQVDENIDKTNDEAARARKEEQEEERRLTKNMRKVSTKKRHEIVKLSKLISDVLLEEQKQKGEEEDGCKSQQHLLLDFGAGLGYLSETLYQRLHQRSRSENDRMFLLGLEADIARVATARERLMQYLPQANGNIAYEQLYIDVDAQATIELAADRLLDSDNEIHESGDEMPMTIIGLHACADLSVTAIELFQRMSRVRNLIIMPCCYHKLQLEPDGCTFTHFPLSGSLRQACQTTVPAASTQTSTIFNRPFLRLACQETSARWSDCSAAQHRAHGHALFWRAVAEVLAQVDDDNNDAIVLTKKRQKLTNCESERVDFTSFTEFSACYELRSTTTGKTLPWHEKHIVQFRTLKHRYMDDNGISVGGKLAEGLTCLQTAMQKLCENLVLYDRRCYMEECANIANVRLKVRYEKVLNEKLSPRCYALIAQKLC